MAIVPRAEGLVREPPQQRSPTVIGRLHDKKLVGLRPVFGIFRVQGGYRIVDRGKTVNMAFAEQVTAIDDLRDQLLERDLLPFPLAALAGAFETRCHAMRAGHLRDHGVAPPAGGGSVCPARVLIGRSAQQRLFHRDGEIDVFVRGQRAVGIAQRPQHAVVAVVDADAHAAHRGAAIADGERQALVGVGRQFAGPEVHTIFGF